MSQQNVPEWMPLYVYEFVADRNVQAMTLDELGAYLRLILMQWANGSVPKDLQSLARLLHCDLETMERFWVALGPCYRDHPTLPGEMIQERVEKERTKAMGRLSVSSRGGKQAQARRRAQRVEPGLEVPADVAEVVKGPAPVLAHWEAFKAAYPAHRLDEEVSCRAMLSREDEAADIVAGLRVAVASKEWAEEEGKFVPRASRFITDGMYKDFLRGAPKVKKPVPFDLTTITGPRK